MRISSYVLPSMALGACALLVLPGSDSMAFSLTGLELDLTQRDFRIFNNFSDPETNNNGTPDSMYPGATGVHLATWKGAVEWGSEPHGDGSGDSTQATLGSGGANFDGFWAGTSTGVGSAGTNIISTTSGCSGGVLAFAELPLLDGWRIRFCDDSFVFADGPDNIPNGQFDYQSILCHEYGHALGLGHSNSSGATMWPSTGSGSESGRSINNDDKAGVQAIYGVKANGKAIICRTSVAGGILTITGSKFTASGNEVWFTRGSASGTNGSPIVVVGGLNATAGGTRIDVAIPALAGPGDVAVRRAGSDSLGRLLSNCFPTDLVGTIDAGCMFRVANATPSTVQALEPGTSQSLTIAGVDLDQVISITLEPSTVIPSSSWTIVDPGIITIDLPTADALGVNTLTFDTGSETDSVNITVVSDSAPVLQMGTGDALNEISDGELLMATLSGTPGDSHRIYYSPSNIPSSFTLANFLIGNNFTELFVAATVTIGANGIGTFSAPLSYNAASAPFYVQSLNLSGGANPEFAISNLQSVTLSP